MKKLDINRIIQQNTQESYFPEYEEYFNGENAIKQAIKEILPDILEYVSIKAETKDVITDNDIMLASFVDKNSIIDLKDDILKKLEIT